MSFAKTYSAKKPSLKDDKPKTTVELLTPLPVTTINNVKVYNVSGSAHKTLPDWLAKKNARSLKKDPVWSKRIEMIQDFEFPVACTHLRLTPDQKFIIGCGTYKPRFRVWELGQAGMKFERHREQETVALEVLGQDYGLLALAQQDRTLEVHEAKGMRHSLKLPKPARDMILDRITGKLLIASASGVQLLDLEAGKFEEPLGGDGSINTCRVGPGHGLYALATSAVDSNHSTEPVAVVEFWDRRCKARVGALSFPEAREATALHFLSDMHVAVGTSEGVVSVLDLRSSLPFLTRDHQNGFEIRGITSVRLPEGSPSSLINRTVVSWDRKAVKAWDDGSSNGSVITLEPQSDIHDVLVQGGFVAVAGEEPKITSYLVPALGPAPRWAAYLEHLTEELQEEDNNDPGRKSLAKNAASKKPVFDEQWQFVVRAEAHKLGLERTQKQHMQAYMHGYLVDPRIYAHALEAHNRLLQEATSSSTTNKKQAFSAISAPGVKVNAKLAETEVGERAIQDERFGKALFADDDYAIDEESSEYRAAHPHLLNSAFGRKHAAKNH